MPIYPHRMRLRGPWECDAPGGGGPWRVTMPCSWDHASLERLTDPVRFQRKFGYPGRIDAHERVWLIGEQVSGAAEIHVNGEHVGHTEPGSIAVDVTRLLTTRNRLEIVMAHPNRSGVVWDDIGLEIRCTAFLDSMTVVRRDDGSLDVAGLVMGSCEGPLEIYGMADGGQEHYQTIAATPEGTPFRFTIVTRKPLSREVRVDLVNVSAVWYAWGRDVGEGAT